MVALPEIRRPETPYVANMAVLWEHWPELAQRLELLDEAEVVPIEPARKQGHTCRLPGPAGAPVYVHSRYDPLGEARKWADAVQATAKEHEDIENGRVPMCYVVDGFGLGYHVEALFERLSGDAFVVVSERNLPLLRAALEHRDYADMLASKRLLLVTRPDRDEIFKTLQPVGSLMMMGTVFTRALQRVDDEFRRLVHQLIGELASYLRSHMTSLLGNGVKTCQNVLHNLPAYVSTPGIDVLQRRFAGMPAVLVAAGPSLRKNLPLLREVRDRIVLISVQTTLKPLLQAGIVPDFVTSLDYHHASARFFQGLTADDLAGIELIAEPKANWHVIDYYFPRGPLRLLGNEFAELVLRELDDDHAHLPAGATVAHLSFYLGEYLGAEPLIMIGQDLGFSDNVYYSPGTALHAVWQSEYNRFGTVEMKEWERIVRHRRLLRKVTDIHGQPIYTDEQMFTYLQQFEKDFARTAATVIDAGGGGVRKQGCLTMSFAEAVETYCREPIDRVRFDYRRGAALPMTDRLEQARDCVARRLEEAREMIDIMAETITLTREMLDLIDDQDALNRKMVRLDELRARVKQRDQIYRMIMYVAQDAELFRFRQDRSLGVDKVEGRDRQRRQLIRDVGYVTRLKAGGQRLIDLLQECDRRLEAARQETAGELQSAGAPTP